MKDISEIFETATAKLLAEYDGAGCWTGELSSSALSTAVAVCALSQFDSAAYAGLMESGLKWLADHVNHDGGWGDTVDSPSNLSTTLLCRSAFAMGGNAAKYGALIPAAEARIRRDTGSTDPDKLAAAVLKSYGEDRTFSVPILSTCAIAGLFGPDSKAWREVPQLPFELAVFPHSLFKLLDLQVVSYAIPALISMGLLRHRCCPAGFPLLSWWRNLITGRALRIVERIQPSNGGFLEATPLTAFVVMSLSAAGFRSHPVAQRGAGFLVKSVRADGSWPIDTNLSTWLTTMSVNALSAGPACAIPPATAAQIRKHLLAGQYKEVHPFTQAAPGAWAWTDLPGAVPDADDTAGALIALRRLGPVDGEVKQAAGLGLAWLVDLQNSDGGIPAFCRGWGRLPFDRSCPDITAHVLRAFVQWRPDADAGLRVRLDKAVVRAIRFLTVSQRADGAWIPLWFGNQLVQGGANPVFGTAQVLMALQEARAGGVAGLDELLDSGFAWLVAARNPDGGWGGQRGTQSSIEETALALAALAGREPDAVEKGLDWLLENTGGARNFRPAPIGLYFSALWYYEKLYPVIFTVLALGRIGAGRGWRRTA